MLLSLLSLALFNQEHRLESFYVKSDDGVRIAVDAFVPAQVGPGESVPVLMEITRYWRASEDPRSGERRRSLNALDLHFLRHGYAVAKVDARGSGASFGSRAVEYGRREVRDGTAVIDALIERDWCDGNVGAYGTSYSGTTAEFLCAVQHPALKAVIPGWSDFDLYESPARPYGLLARGLVDRWSAMVGWMDEGNVARMGGQVARVDEDEDGALRDAALREHDANPEVRAVLRRAEFRDDVMAAEDTWFDGSSLGWRAEIEGSGVPMLVLASWLDAGTAEGALQRFRHYCNPQNVVILASNHGGAQHASPFAPRGAPVQPTVLEQFELRRRFFDHHLEGDDEHGVADWPALRYFNLGEERYHDTATWPPAGVRDLDFLLAEGRQLVARSTPLPAAATASGEDRYPVDFGVSTGTSNRWHTQMGAPVGGLDDRAAMNARMLCYTTPPLPGPLQISGTPMVELHLSSTHADGAFPAYLEAIDPEGRVRNVTEGGLRAIHRELDPDPLLPAKGRPVHSFRRTDARPLVPGEAARLSFRLWPTSILVPAGHRLRLALAGADADTFERTPAEGEPVWTLIRGGTRPSRLVLPVQAEER